jgi:hypothetical protein
MRKTFFIVLIQLFIVFYSVGFARTASQITVSISKLKGYVGEPFEISVIVKSQNEADDVTAELKIDNFEILSNKKLESNRDQDYYLFERRIKIIFWETGDFKIRPIKVNLLKGNKVIEELKTNSLDIKIVSSLKKGENNEKNLKPIKPLVKIRGTILYFLKYLVFVLFIIIFLYLLLRYIKKQFKKDKSESIPKLSPVEEYKRDWEKLKSSKLIEKGKLKYYFITLTEIIKKFLSGEYNFNAEDLTSFETLMELKILESDGILRDKFNKLLDFSDKVKFAKYIPNPDDIEGLERLTDDILGVYLQRKIERERLEKENAEKNT